MRILVTGGCGFIGTRLVRKLADAGHETLVIDDLRVDGTTPPRPKDASFVQRSLGDPEAARAIVDFAPDMMFHLAALHVIPYCEAHPEETEEVNVAGSRWLLDTLGKTSCDTLVACSSAAVYGFDDLPLTEAQPCRPSSVYGRSKTAMEVELQSAAAKQPGLRVVAARLFNVSGPGDFNPHVIPSLIDQVLAGEQVRLGNTWPMRDYIHVDDVAEALIALSSGESGFHVYNVATGTGTSVSDVVQTTAELLGAQVNVVTDPARVRADDGHLVGDASKLQAATGWRPRYTVRDGVVELLAARGRQSPSGRVQPVTPADSTFSAGSWEHPTVDVLGLNVSVADHDLLRHFMEKAVANRNRLAITFANPNYVMAAQREPTLLERINQFDMVLADGWGVVLAARMLGQPLPTRMANDDITDTIFGLTADRGWRLFLFGSAPGVAEKAGRNLQEWFPGLDVVGTEHGYWDVERGTPGRFHPIDVDHIVDEINAAQPDFLVVGVPTPLQQDFVIENRHRLEVPIILTGGSYLDHLAEGRNWFPPVVMRMRVGWLYRLSRDPGRLWYRYSVELADYLWRVSKAAARTGVERRSR